jgi:mannosyltransferase
MSVPQRGLANDPPSAWEAAVLGLIVAFAALLRFHALAAKGFWFDEGISIGIARLDWYDFGRILWRREANMSLYYLLLRGWLYFGHSEAFIRSLSVIFGLATIPVLYLLGRRLFGPWAGLIAAALLAVNGFHLQASQEARSYSLFVFLGTLSSLYFVKALQHSSSRGHVLSSVLSVYAHFFAALLLAAQWVSLRLLDRASLPRQKPMGWRWIVLLSLPVAAFVATTGAGPLNWLRRPGLKEIWQLVENLAGSGGPWVVAAYAIACLIAIIPAVRTAAVVQVPWQEWRYRFLLLWLLLPPAFILVVSLARPLFLPRYFIFCLPALLLLAAAGLARLRSAWVAIPAVLLLLALSLGGARSYFRERPQYDDWRDISHSVLSQSRPGDALVFDIAMSRIPYEYYHSIWPADPAPQVIYPSHASHITFLDFVAKPDYAELASSLPRYQRVWLVLSHTGDPATAEPAAANLLKLLHAAFPAAQELQPGNCVVFLFSKGDAKN